MFQINDDKSIYVTRGDILCFNVNAVNTTDNTPYTFKPGDLLRMKVYGKKNCENVVLEKDFPITAATLEAEIFLDENDTKIGEVISKPTDYWYEVELNPLSDPQTIIGYDEDGAKVFKLFPEGADIEKYIPTEDDLPFVDAELDLGSMNPVQNQAVSRAVERLRKTIDDIAANTLPQQFGAVGDGVSDDSGAFKKAIEAIEKGGTLLLPFGTYYFAKNVEITKDISIVGMSGVITGKGLRIKGAKVYLSGVNFQDTNKNAVTMEANADLTVRNCRFENIGTDAGIDVTYQGCGIHASGGYNLSVYNSVFVRCHGHGGVFCHDSGNLIVKDCRFDSNDYRAISTFGTTQISGVISGNYICDCGKYNPTGSGVGCNGIFSPNGSGIVCENNTILSSRENGIEGAYLKIVGNYIDGTGVEKETKPTPSVEGIWYANSFPAYIANNIILNTAGSGIKTFREKAITDYTYIIGNVIRGCGNSKAIDIVSSVSVDNLYIADNKVSDFVSIVNTKRSNAYIGDVAMLDVVGNIDITKNKMIYDFHHYFEKIEPFTYSNCSPMIVEGGGEKYVEVVYDTYSRLMLDVPSLQNTFHMLDVSLYGKGKFTVNLQRNGSFYKTIFTVDSKEFIDKHAAINIVGAASDKFKITIAFQQQTDVETGQEDSSCIKTFDMGIYR